MIPCGLLPRAMAWGMLCVVAWLAAAVVRRADPAAEVVVPLSEVVDRMVAAFNADCLPVVPCKGTVGASGDLAPLSHLALVPLLCVARSRRRELSWRGGEQVQR